MRCGETQELLGVFTVTKFPAVSIYPSNTGLGELRKLAKVQLNYQIVPRHKLQEISQSRIFMRFSRPAPPQSAYSGRGGAPVATAPAPRGSGLAVRHPPNNVARSHPAGRWPSSLGDTERETQAHMNTFRRYAAALLFAVPSGISAPAFAQPAAIAVDREACVISGTAATPAAAIAACTRLLDALAPGEIASSEGAAVYIARGNLYAVQGEVDRAIADYDTAITLDPNRAVAFFNRATALMEKGEIDRALFDFDHAIELDPMDADARVGRGRAYYQKKDYAAALTDYDAAIRLVPNNPEALAERGDANERAGLYDRAAEDYGRLIAIEPGNAKAWNNSCWDHAVLGRLEEALADCNEALRLAPDDPTTLDSRGFTYLKLGRFEQAIADYDAALARNPRDPGSLYGRGLARLRSQNDPEGGRADLAAAKALDPGVVAEFARYGLGE
jgi:tetratricopeptide (TPR) repeat protein